jgi:hypothetical protein
VGEAASEILTVGRQRPVRTSESDPLWTGGAEAPTTPFPAEAIIPSAIEPTHLDPQSINARERGRVPVCGFPDGEASTTRPSERWKLLRGEASLWQAIAPHKKQN